jgi:30S ribosomal protein S31
MGKGDRKTKKGKINKGTFGVSRPKKKTTAVAEKPKAKKK